MNQSSLIARCQSISLLTMCLAMQYGCGTSEPPAPPRLDIPVAEVIQRDADVTIELVGQTRGSTDIPIRARVQGFLESQDFDEGSRVEKGRLLYTIDPDPYRAKVVEAEGRLAEARTMLAKAKSDLDRIRPLAEMNAVSQRDLDSAVAQHEAALGNLQASQALLEQAEIEFSYTRIQAPTDGFIGISRAEVGEFVGEPPNPVILNYVSLTDPIRVRFAINERDYLRLARQISGVRQTAPEARGSGQALRLMLADGTLHPYPGHVTAFDAAINPETGTFTLEADFPNPDNLILAGQFARVIAVTERLDNAILIPMRAVSELQGIYRVFVVADDGTVELRRVELGPQVDNLWVIRSGLEPGEKVALSGLLRLTDGATVNPQLVDPLAKGNPSSEPGG